jgi:hypothetical protein
MIERDDFAQDPLEASTAYATSFAYDAGRVIEYTRSWRAERAWSLNTRGSAVHRLR